MAKKGSSNFESWVLVLYTGGTIGMIENDQGALAPVANKLVPKIRQFWQMHDTNYAVRFSHMADPPLVLPARKGERRVIYKIQELSPLLDSSNMTMSDWIHIAHEIKNSYQAYDGFVILHGTDTLSYTASALSFMLENLGKTVVVTGSQVPIFEIRSDGVDNFLGSLIIAGNYVIPEVTVFFGDKLLRGNRTIKVSSDSEQAFDSPNAAPLATFGINIQVNSQQIFRSRSMEKFSVHSILNQNVGLLRIFPGITAATVEAFLQPPIEGVVLQSYGSGNVPDNRQDIVAAFSVAAARGVIVVNCTQCLRGSVRGLYATSEALVDAGVISGYDMTPEAALTKLSYVLSKVEWDLDVKRQMMKTNLRGELTIPELCEADDTNLHDVIASSLKMTSEKEAQQVRDVFFPAAMCVAACEGNIPQLLFLERQGGDFSMANADLRTPLHVACAEGHSEVVQLALCRGASVHVRDRYERTPLDEAIAHNWHDVIRILLMCGASLCDRDDSAVAEVMCRAAAHGHILLLKSYRLAGASFDKQDVSGRTPLHLAVLCNQVACTEYLVDSGVNLAIKDTLGQTPLDFAQAKNHVVILELLTRDDK